MQNDMNMKKELKIGIFAIVVLLISFFVLNYIKGEDIFNRENEYVAYYADAEGLVASAPVYVKGFKAGKVSEMSYDSVKGMFKVVCSVSKQFDVPSDSRMVIYGVDIMGSKGVRIDLGSSEVVAEDNAILASAYEPGLVDALALEIAPLMQKAGKVIDSLGVTIEGVNNILADVNPSSVSGTIAHLEALMADLHSISSDVNGKSGDLIALIDNLKDFSDSLKVIASVADSTLTGINDAVSSVNDADLTGTIIALKTLLNNINDPDGSVGKLFVDDTVYNSVDSLLVNINDLVDKIQQNPKKYLKISVF